MCLKNPKASFSNSKLDFPLPKLQNAALSFKIISNFKHLTLLNFQSILKQTYLNLQVTICRCFPSPKMKMNLDKSPKL
ncbi:MAG: hypothetical protein ACTS4U_00930 [Candidatus Hodgkinia cicadicola]